LSMYFWSSLIWAASAALSPIDPRESPGLKALTWLGERPLKGERAGSSDSLPPEAISSRARANLSSVLLTAAADDDPGGYAAADAELGKAAR